MPFPIRRSTIPPGLPRIDYENPITAGLVGAYLPSATPNGQLIYDLTYQSPAMGLQSAATYTNSSEGLSLKSAVASSGAIVTAGTRLQFTGAAPGFSIFWRGVVLTGALTNNTGNSAIIWGLTFNNTESAPYLAYGIMASVVSNTDCGLSWSPAGTHSSVRFTPAAGTTNSLAGTFLNGANATFYVNGQNFNAVAITTPITYGTAPQLLTGSFGLTGTEFTNTLFYVGYIWNRVLTDAEMMTLNSDPYGMFAFHDLFSVGTSNHITSRKATASFGTRAGSRQTTP